MEVVEPALQKKYHKITGISRGNSVSNMNDLVLLASLNAIAPSRSTPSSLPKPSEEAFNAQNCLRGAPGRPDVSIKIEPTMTGLPSSSPLSMRKPLPTLQQQAQMVLQQNRGRMQPLNLTSDNGSPFGYDNCRKRSQSNASVSSCMSTSSTITAPLHIDTSSSSAPHENLHPQNPERSIIKSLLLNSRGLAVPTTGEGDDAVYTCPLCKITFRSADNLQYHTKCYCQGTPASSSQMQQQRNHSPQSAPISPVGSPSHKYFRSNSFNLCLPEKYSPNTLAKLASSSLRHPHRTPLSLAKLAAQQTTNPYQQNKGSMSGLSASPASNMGRTRPENIVINTSTCPAPTPLTMSSANAYPSSSLSVSSQCVQITKQLIDASLPSPGPLLGKTRLVDTYSGGLISEFRKYEDTDSGVFPGYAGSSMSPSTSTALFTKQDSITITPISSMDGSSLSKRARLNNYPMTSLPLPISFSHAAVSAAASFAQSNFSQSTKDSLSSHSQISRLQMCGGGIKIVAKKEEIQPRFGLSGGSIICISPTSETGEPSPMNIRTGLNSGGSVIETPKKTQTPSPNSTQSSDQTPKTSLCGIVTPQSAQSYISSTGSKRSNSSSLNYFQFPPINSITGYNPLTLPPHSQAMSSIEATKILHAGKLIPFVPGIPGPNSLVTPAPIMSSYRKDFSVPQSAPSSMGRSPSPSRKKIIPSSPIAIRAVPSPLSHQTQLHPSPSRFNSYNKSSFMAPQGSSTKIGKLSPKSKTAFSKVSPPIPQSSDSEESQRSTSSAFSGIISNSFPGASYFTAQTPTWAPGPFSKIPQEPNTGKKSFNFSRMADNVSPLKQTYRPPSNKSTDSKTELRHFNFENLIPKPEVIMRPKQERLSGGATSPLHIDVTANTTIISSSITIPTLVLPATTSSDGKENGDEPMLKPPQTTTPTTTASTKFLRPSSLPLKPGTFTPKCHHGITPTANTLPLISPETPRPSKNCVQLYLNGHAYTYLGLKCSTKPFYCTVNRPQPIHFTNQPKLSIYSNWQVCAESSPHPLGLSPKEAMSLYDSRQRLQQHQRGGKMTIAQQTSSCSTLHSQMVVCSTFDNRQKQIGTPDLSAQSQQPHSSGSFVRFEASMEDKKPTPSELNVMTSDDIIVPIPMQASPKQEPQLSGGEELSNQKLSDGCASPTSSTPSSVSVVPPVVPGGYESNEDYTYVRGRGRGRYVCSECGIRCKKPSMLKKHIRTHTDVRPYTCQHCSFR